MNLTTSSARSRLAARFAMLAALGCIYSSGLQAVVAGNLPWERPMQTIGLVVSVLVFAAPMLASAFGVNAAVV
jgi:hypothetical protein